MNDDERRSIEFARWFVGRTSTEVVPFRWGKAYLDAEFPLRYDSNFLWVEDAPGDVTAEALVEEAERILGGRGMRHRSVLVDDAPLAQRLGMPFGELGWGIDAIVLMVLRGDPGSRSRRLGCGGASVRRAPCAAGGAHASEPVGDR